MVSSSSTLILAGLSLVLANLATGALNTNYVIDRKYAANVDGYFATPHLIKAKAYWEQYKIIDETVLATVPVATQVEFAASSETADVYVPGSYARGKALGIYIHMNGDDSAHMPAAYQSSLDNLYCIGASPDHAGNSRHDAWRIARALDLIASLKARYDVDDERIFIGGYSGGALISLLAGMLYPDVFKGIVPTEHIMQEAYWGKVFTAADLAQMAGNGQRWAFIIGGDYAPWWFAPHIATWRDTHGFKTLHTVVPGMGHSQPPTAILEDSIRWVDAPVQRQRATTFLDWNDHCYDSSHGTSGLGVLDDYDNDTISNGMEYVLGLDPTTPDATAPSILVGMNGRKAVLRYRRAATDIQMLVATSSDLVNWDETGDNLTETSVNYDSKAFANCEYQTTLPDVSKIFFKARAVINN
jgi:pimeloyl-ACP methyl ester carboxylesterase